MAPEEFSRAIEIKANEIKSYAMNRFPSMAGNIALRFVNGNFRAGGYQGASFDRWKKTNKKRGSTLVVTGALRADTSYTTQPGEVTLKNGRPYAKAHNEGFEGTVTIKAHKRNKYSKTKVGTGRLTKTGKERTKTMTVKSGESTVKAHSRKMKIPKRQFMPTSENDSPVLNNAIQRQLTRDINQIMQ